MEKLVSDNIILIGTAHVSKKSVEEVESAIIKYKPDIVAVELDEKRYQAITKKHKWEKTSVLEVIKTGKGFLLLVQTFLAMIQRKLGKEFGVEPGAEMIVAIKTAKKHEILVALVDRDITITFKRAWRLMTMREKLRLFWYSMKALIGYDRLEEELEAELEKERKEKETKQEKTKDGEKQSDSKEAALSRLMQEDVISALMEELRKVVPNATKALIDERDQYISRKISGYVDGRENRFIKFKKRKFRVIKGRAPKVRKIKSSSTKLEGEKKKRVLAVVGAGHMSGIKKNLSHPEKLPELSSLEEVPRKRISILKSVGYLIPILFAALFLYLLYYAKWETLIQVLLAWFLINGICSAIGAAIALGHPLTILTAFLAAPFTSLNPTIGAGWVAGYVEVKLRGPNVKDIRKLSTIETMKDFFGNRVIKVLMVMALANLGSMIGTFIAWYYIGDLVLF
jgi:pheromone shutdown protein TraB